MPRRDCLGFGHNSTKHAFILAAAQGLKGFDFPGPDGHHQAGTETLIRRQGFRFSIQCIHLRGEVLHLLDDFGIGGTRNHPGYENPELPCPVEG